MLGRHDDQVDSLSLAFSRVTQRVPIQISPEAVARSARPSSALEAGLRVLVITSARGG